jgi:hypothetical protein
MEFRECGQICGDFQMDGNGVIHALKVAYSQKDVFAKKPNHVG